MDSHLYRASLLAGEVLAVSTDGDENELDTPRATTLRVCSMADGRCVHTEFFGTSLHECVAAAAEALAFEFVNLSDPSGVVTRRHLSIEASDEQITFRARFAHGNFDIFESDDDDDDDDSDPRLMAVDVADGEREIFKGKNLYDCIAAAKRHFQIASVRFGKLSRRGDGAAESTEAQKHAGWVYRA